MQREQNLSEILNNFSDLDKEAQIQNVVKLVILSANKYFFGCIG
jgi:hypothetical protein